MNTTNYITMCAIPWGVAAFLLFGCGPKAQPFDSAAWKELEPSMRFVMLDDLLAQHDLANMTTNEVVELLGPPAPSLPPFFTKDTVLAYYVGPSGSKQAAILNLTDRGQLPGDKYRVYVTRPELTILD